MRAIVLLFISLLPMLNVFAVPADGVPRNVVQTDGTILTLRQCGDEHYHYMITNDGLVVQENVKGGYYYAIFHAGRLLTSSVLAHNPDERKRSEQLYVGKRLEQRLDADILDSLKTYHGYAMQSANERRLKQTISRRSLGEPTQYIGEKKGLVILVEFPNLSMKSQTANADHLRMFNEVGYSDYNHVGSVHDYFFDQSYGKFDLTFDVIGPITVKNNYGYYGSDALSGSNDMNVREMIKEACILADELVDFRNYDWDNDGIVDQVFIIYAGYGQATGGPSNTIWPHESVLLEDLALDGVKIHQYACSNELYKAGVGGQDMLMGIGTACHEFSHCLGLPDLYDTDYSGAYGMGYWSLMNSGSYSGPNGIGEVPCGYTAFERWFTGWLDFKELNTSQKVESIPCLEKAPVAYKLVNEASPKEFYTIENRQADKWYSYVAKYKGMHGLLIAHIDYDENAWKSNRVNPTLRHQRMSPIVADNSYTITPEGLFGDLFPGMLNVTELTNTSHIDYGGKLYNKNTDDSYNINKSILNILENEDGSISFDVVFNEEIPTPNALEASDVSHDSFKARWICNNDNAENYTIELEIIKSIKPFIFETKLIENVTQTEYHVENIVAHSCNYRVRSNREGLSSEWSNQIVVTLKKTNGIENVTTSRKEPFVVYSLDGIKANKTLTGIIIKDNKKMISK